MSNDHFPVWLYRWSDENEHHDASSVSWGESREVSQHYPSTIIGVATRPVGKPIEHHNASPEYEVEAFQEFREHVEDHADDVRWFDDAMECDTDA
jgi:hypothetical protein